LTALMVSSCDVEDLLRTTDPPEVSRIYSSAENFLVQPLDTAEFWVTATDPGGLQLTYQWSVNGGSIIGTRSSDRVIWAAPLTGNIYNISVNVANSEESTTRSENITVPSLSAPLVNIESPEESSYLVQNSTVVVRARASHENGISSIAFYANDSLIQNQGGISGSLYNFVWLIAVPAGKAELKVVATANVTGAQGMDKVQVNIEGIIPGKLNGN